MTEEEEGSASAQEKGTSVTIERVTGLEAMTWLMDEAAKQVKQEARLLATGLVGKAKTGDLQALKMLLDLLGKSLPGAEFSAEEVECFSALLLREFQGLSEQENGEEKSEQ